MMKASITALTFGSAIGTTEEYLVAQLLETLKRLH